MTYELHPKVAQDLDDAAGHLAKHTSSRTVVRFLAEFERVANLLVENPGIGTPMSRGRRVFPFRIFKYLVVYRLVAGTPRILIVRHARRRPGLGGGRS